LFDSKGTTVDFRTGLTSHGLPKGKLLRHMVLGALPIPPELLEEG
jgi:hypothetical protein